MDNDDPMPPGAVPLTLACNVCGSAIHTWHDPEAPGWVIAKLSRSIACVGCIARADGAAMARQAADRLEIRSQMWETLCPHEFRAPLDFARNGRELYDRLMAWQFGPRGLFLSGRTGKCKTRYLLRVLEREFLAGRSCAFVAHIDFRREVSYLSQTDPLAMRRYMAVLMKADVVLFDDLGAGVITAAGEEAFEGMLAARCRNGKPTLFSANSEIDALGTRFSADRSEPILRRLREFSEQVKV